MATLPQGFEIEQPSQPPVGDIPVDIQQAQQQAIQQPIAPQQQAVATLPAGFEIETQPEAVAPSFPGAGIIEPTRAVVSAAGREIAGGFAGIFQALNPFAEEGAGAETVRAFQEGAFQPTTEAGRRGLEVLGNLVQKGIDIANFPISGVAGLVELVSGQGLDQAVETIKSTQERGISTTAGQRIFEETGSPLAATLAEVAPTAVVELLALGAPAVVGRATQQVARQAEVRGARLSEEAEELRAPKTAEEGLEQVSETIKTGTPEDIARVIQPDPEFFKAADELNINVEPLASFASQNPQFRAVEQGLASIPASQLDIQGKAFINEVSQKADNLITEYGGTLDKAELSDRFRTESLSTIDDLGVKADDLYETLSVKIPAASRVEAPNTVDFILQKARDLGGRQELPAVMNRILRQLEVKEKTGPSKITDVITGKPIPGKVTRTLPTYERLNLTRRAIGQAINKGTGPFKDQETGLLKALYSRLRQDQDVVAGNFGATDVSDSANAIVRQRKHLEDNLAKLLGKDLEGSILPKVGQALKRLSKGDIQKWDSLMGRIPNSIRQEIVVTSLNDIFKGTGVQAQSLNPTQFTKFMDDLDRSPAIKSRLFKELPSESIKALENLRTVSKGISIALQDRIPTGRVAAFFEDNDGFLRRMMGKALVLGVTAKAGPLAGSAASEFINQTTDGAKSAASVLASTQFQNIIRTAVRDGITEGAAISDKLKKSEKAFERSKVFNRWAKALSEDDRAKLASVGTVTYLLKDQEQRQEQAQ